MSKPKQAFVVGDQFRTNELSLQPGGSTVTVVYTDGSNRIYPNVKNPRAYISAISKKDQTIVKAQVDGVDYWTR